MMFLCLSLLISHEPAFNWSLWHFLVILTYFYLRPHKNDIQLLNKEGKNINLDCKEKIS